MMLTSTELTHVPNFVTPNVIPENYILKNYVIEERIASNKMIARGQIIMLIEEIYIELKDGYQNITKRVEAYLGR